MKVSSVKIGLKNNKCLVMEDLGIIDGRRSVKVLCDCGKVFNTRYNYIASGATKSCGCNWKSSAQARWAHKGKKNRGANGKIKKTYRTWALMKDRCLNKRSKKYNDYGGRGIFICDEWIMDYNKFYSDMGEPPTPKHSIERINNNDGYYKENCKWATSKEQNNNRRPHRKHKK